MYSGKAIVTANKTPEGYSVINISVYDESGRNYCSSKRLIDKINATPLLDRERIKSIVSRQYGIRTSDITFD